MVSTSRGLRPLSCIATGLLVCVIIALSTMSTNAQSLEQKVDDNTSAIEKLSKLKVSGYIQVDFQNADYQADGNNFKLQNRLNAYEAAEDKSYSRFGVRRGRIKFTYEEGLFQAVFQPDITQNGVSFKDVYLKMKDP